MTPPAPRSPSSIPRRRCGTGRRTTRKRPRPTTSASITRWSRRGLPFEFLSDQAMTPGSARPLQAADPAQRGLPVRRPVPDARATMSTAAAASSSPIESATARRERRRRARRSGSATLFGATDDRRGARAGQEHLCRAQRRPPDRRGLRGRRADHRRHAPDGGRGRRTAPRRRSSTCPTSPTCRWKRSIPARRRAAPPSWRARPPRGGRTVHIPWNIGEIFWEVLAADHQRLIENAVRWALGRRAGGRGRRATRMLDVAVRDGDDGMAGVADQPHQSR